MKHSYIIGAVMVVLMVVVFIFSFQGDDAVNAEKAAFTETEVSIGVRPNDDVVLVISKNGTATCYDLYKVSNVQTVKDCGPPETDTTVNLKKITSGFHAGGSCYVCWGGTCYAC